MNVIVNYGLGNLKSVENMIRKIGFDSLISSNPRDIEKAGKIILPGVGSFANGMEQISKLKLLPVLNKKALEEKVPVLGICLGMQLLFTKSEEGNCRGLNWITGEVKKFPDNNGLKIPHMGWNTITVKQPKPLLKGLETDARFYFVHSYRVTDISPANIAATTNYGAEFACVVQSGKIFGTQFHPEKSHRFGKQLIKNFLEI